MDDKEWLKTQSKDVQKEFEDMDRKLSKANSREKPVGDIVYGNKLLSLDCIDRLRYFMDRLTEIQQNVYNLYYIECESQKKIALILDIDQSVVSKHIKAIKIKAYKLMRLK